MESTSVLGKRNVAKFSGDPWCEHQGGLWLSTFKELKSFPNSHGVNMSPENFRGVIVDFKKKV